MVKIDNAPIRTHADLVSALDRVNELIDAYAPGTPEADELEVLSVLISDYEARTIDIPDATPAEVLRFIMEHNSLAPEDLIPFIGSLDRVQEVLAEKRKLSVPMIRKLSEGLRIPAEALL